MNRRTSGAGTETARGTGHSPRIFAEGVGGTRRAGRVVAGPVAIDPVEGDAVAEVGVLGAELVVPLGCTVGDYVRRLRVRRACELLTTTTLSALLDGAFATIYLVLLFALSTV